MGAEQSNVVISEKKRAEMHASCVLTVVSEQEKTERIVKCAAVASSRAANSPYFIARSLPHNAISPSTDMNTQENAFEFFDKLLESTVVYDSASDTAEITQPDCLQFIDYYLPGICERDSWDNTPIAAQLWDKKAGAFAAELSPYVELARKHPGDKFVDDSKHGIEGSLSEDYDKSFQPVTTKAGSRLWSIGFSEAENVFTQLRASYPFQLLTRYDRGRDMLIYEAFEYKPMLLCNFEKLLASGIAPVTPRELRQIEKLIRVTNRERSELLKMMEGNMTDGKIKLLPPELSHMQKCEQYGCDFLFPIVSYIRFQKSIQRRVRFNVSEITGIRLVAFDFQRPNAMMPPAKGSISLDCIGRTGSDEDRTAIGPELGHGDDVGPLAMLVIETSGNIDAMTFSSMTVSPASCRTRQRIPTPDWTEDKISRSTRHYLVGDMCEMKELLNYLAYVSTHIAKLLGLNQAVDRMISSSVNSLSGSRATLHPRMTSRVMSLQALASRILTDTNGESQLPAPRLDTKEKIDSFLKKCGISNPQKVNICLKAGILYGYIKVDAKFIEADDPSQFLDTVLYTGNCLSCNEPLSCTVRMALYQKTCGGDDYADGSKGGAVKCKESCDGNYITRLCEREPRFDCGKGTNHCIYCPDYGTCIGDYRNSHCFGCGDHYFSCRFGEGCYCGFHDDDEYDDEYDDGASDATPILPNVSTCWSGQLDDIDLFLQQSYEQLITDVLEGQKFLKEDIRKQMMITLFDASEENEIIDMDESKLRLMPIERFRILALSLLRSIESVKYLESNDNDESVWEDCDDEEEVVNDDDDDENDDEVDEDEADYDDEVDETDENHDKDRKRMRT